MYTFFQNFDRIDLVKIDRRDTVDQKHIVQCFMDILKGNISLRNRRDRFDTVQTCLLIKLHQSAVIPVKVRADKLSGFMQPFVVKLILRQNALFKKLRRKRAGMNVVAEIDDPDRGSVDHIDHTEMALPECGKIFLYRFRIIVHRIYRFFYSHQVDIQSLHRNARHKNGGRAQVSPFGINSVKGLLRITPVGMLFDISKDL